MRHIDVMTESESKKDKGAKGTSLHSNQGTIAEMRRYGAGGRL